MNLENLRNFPNCILDKMIEKDAEEFKKELENERRQEKWEDEKYDYHPRPEEVEN